MKRNFFIFLVFVACSYSSLAQDSLDWLLIYYAPYDNNLSHYSDSILNQLESARQFDNVQVVLQVDKADSSGMLRYTITPTGTIVDSLDSDNSTSRKELTNYMRWASDEFNFKHSAVFFLDHGGGLDEVGQDLLPDSSFLTTASIRKSLLKFNKWNRSKIDLLYLQVCAKASIEPLYELKDVSEYTLASQQLLGAPNYYYFEAIKYLSNTPNCNGLDLAKEIATKDRTDMISVLTCIDNSQFDLTRSIFRALTFELEKKDALHFTKAPLTYEYGNDRYWDLVDFLNCLDLKASRETQLRDKLIDHLQNKLIVYSYSPKSNSKFCGMSIASISKDRMGAFWRKMDFYRDFRMNQLPVR